MTRPTFFRLLAFVATLLFIIAGTYLLIRYAKGDRLTAQKGVTGTGLLAANSFPPGAEVYINSRLTTATDNTLNLDPGQYDVSIKKDGYHSWDKHLTITAELVTQTNAQLFPTSPTLEPLSYTGAINPVPSADGSHLAYVVASASANAKNGLYVQDLGGSALTINKTTRQIARTNSDYDFTTASYTWSPNNSEILVAFKNGSHLLLDASRFTDSGNFIDVTATLTQTFREWESELASNDLQELQKLPDFMEYVASSSATNLYFSPDGNRLLYQATKDLTIPDNLIPPLPASSTQKQTRTLSPGSWYVYDLKEDRNFLVAASALASPVPSLSPKIKKTTTTALPAFVPTKILLPTDLKTPLPAELGTSSASFRKLQENYTVPQTMTLFNAQYSSLYVTSIQWYPDSAHLVITTGNGIDIMEYDSTNRLTLYAGPMDKSFVYPWPDGSRLITLIQFTPDTAPNLYTIKLK